MNNLYKEPKKWLKETYKGQSFNQNEKIVKPITIILPKGYGAFKRPKPKQPKRIDKGVINV